MEVRRSTTADAGAVRELAFRLSTGVAPWRNKDAVLTAVCAWVDAALAGHDDQHPVFVAETMGRIVGFAAAGARKHSAGPSSSTTPPSPSAKAARTSTAHGTGSRARCTRYNIQ